MRSRHYDDWTIESWRIEPRRRAADPDLDLDTDEADANPPLWQDVTLATVLAAIVWGAAAIILA